MKTTYEIEGGSGDRHGHTAEYRRTARSRSKAALLARVLADRLGWATVRRDGILIYDVVHPRAPGARRSARWHNGEGR